MTSISVFIDQHLSPKAQSRMLARAAKEIIAEVKAEQDAAAGRKGPPPRVTVDGRKGASIDSVKPNGEIIAEFNTGTDVVTWILFELQKHSPVKTGAYEGAHATLVDGKPYVEGMSLTGAAEIVILNPVPYARKIERGQGSAPTEGVYQAVALLAGRRYHNFATVSFTYRAIRDGNLEAYVGTRTRLAGVLRGGRIGKREAQGMVAGQQARQRERRAPAIVVRMR